MLVVLKHGKVENEARLLPTRFEHEDGKGKDGTALTEPGKIEEGREKFRSRAMTAFTFPQARSPLASAPH